MTAVRVALRVETDRVLFTLTTARDDGEPTPEGTLIARARRPDADVRTSWESPRGPALREQTEYVLYAHARGRHAVNITHRDPLVLRGLIDEEGGSVAHGSINFGSHVGLSDVTILVDGVPEFELRVEVLPSKLEYESDYEALRDEVQNTLAGLALEYLRPTHEPARTVHSHRASGVEWATILRQSCDELERALRDIARAPAFGLTRTPALARAEIVKRPDAAVRAAVRRGSGSGAPVRLSEGLPVRSRLHEHRARATLDTPEHRWLAASVRTARRDASRLREREAARETGPRREKILGELSALDARLTALLALEPLAAAVEPPPLGFSSLRMQTAPAYREAYRACLLLGMGLRADEGPMNVSLKDLGALYEYYCYLTTLRILAEESGLAVPLSSLFTVRETGLSVNLERGRETRVRFDLSPGRAVTAAYNPRLSGALLPTEQQPDVLIRLEQDGWEPSYVLLDAKYRLDSTAGYRQRFGTHGPPVDALNTLHRYRDAIVERDTLSGMDRPARVVVAAAALYPHREAGDFRAGALWQSLERVGVGAIPLLPGGDLPLRVWLRSTLARGAWGLADRAVSHRTVERAHFWSQAANETVLLATTGSRGARAVFQRCQRHGGLFVPLDPAGGGRALSARWIALFVPRRAAVAHVARVVSVTVATRDEVPEAVRDGDARLYGLLHTGPWMPLEHPLESEHGGAARAFWPGFTSQLALDRARTLEELWLASEHEWRLFESLVAVGAAFDLALDDARSRDESAGRVWFTSVHARLRHAGGGMFASETAGRNVGLRSLDEAMAALRGGD